MSSKVKRVALLGSTGSIGTQTLEVITELRESFKVVSLSAGKNIQLVKEQIIAVKPEKVCVQESQDKDELGNFLKENSIECELLSGQEGLEEICADDTLDLVVMAIVGTASLRPTVTALEVGTPIAIACKEVLVAAGDLIMPKAKEKRVPILPIDSEHAALKQCLAGIDEEKKDVSRLILTASGGPFWEKPIDEFKTITKEMALKHPSWIMGSKITIDSATMMNKGLEVIEAYQLFGIPFDQIDVVIHPHSIIHSIVEFSDFTMLAQMGLPDMRFPIQYALTYPDKLPNPWPKTYLVDLPPLTFHQPDLTKFPMLKLAYESGKKGGDYPVILNASNEVAVHQFLHDQIQFYEIPKVVEGALEKASGRAFDSIEEIVELDYAIKKDGGLVYE